MVHDSQGRSNHRGRHSNWRYGDDNMDANRHRVRNHKWNNGVLEWFDNYFATLEEAILFAQSQIGFTVKVFDYHGNLVFSITVGPQEPVYC